LAATLAGGLPANFIACAAQLPLQPGGGGCSGSVLTDTLQQEKTKFSKVRPLMPLLLPKIPLWTRHCCASRVQHLSAGKRANFWVGAKICPFAQKTKEIHKIFKGRKLIEKLVFNGKIHSTVSLK
jgi:hypothetical protein